MRPDDFLWSNILKIRTESGTEFARYILEARSDFLRLRMQQELALRQVYWDAADRVAVQIQSLGASTSPLTKVHLRQLEKGLRDEGERISQAVGQHLKGGVATAFELGARPLQLKLFSDLRTAGTGLDLVRLQQGFAEVNTRAVEAFWTRTRNGLKLSERVWQTGQHVQDQVRLALQNAVAQGQDVVKTAREIQQWLKSGTPSSQFTNMMRRMNGRVPKNLPYEALRLARTEMTISFQEGTYAAGRVTPSYRGARWMLSTGHPMQDVCDDLATADLYGLGPGGYAAGSEPITPHPNCLCYVVPIMEDTRQFVERLRRWLDDPASEPDLDHWYNGMTGSNSTGPKVKASPANKYQPVHQLADAEKWATTTFPNITWDFRGAHVDAINPVLKQFQRLSSDYPSVVGRINYIGTYVEQGKLPKVPWASNPFPGNAYAHASPKGILGLNPSWFGQPSSFQTALDKDLKAGWHPAKCNSYSAVFTHEFGHHVYYWLSDPDLAVTPFVASDGTGSLSHLFSLWQAKNTATTSLSTYAMHNAKEAWAEGFASLYHSGASQAHPYVQGMKTLLSELKKVRIYGASEWKSLQSLPPAQQAQAEKKMRQAWDKLLRRLGLA